VEEESSLAVALAVAVAVAEVSVWVVFGELKSMLMRPARMSS
jgi:hypothetical protein